jgi:hypothetical protein
MGGECRWRSTHTEMGMLVEMEMAVRRWRWNAGTRAHTSSPLAFSPSCAGMDCALAPLQVEVGTYPLLLPTRLALAFAPRSDPRPRPAFPSLPLCRMGRTCFKLRRSAHTPRTRRDGKARVRVRVQVPVPANPPLAIALAPRAQPAQYAYTLRKGL